jgi:hypothetical protein
MSVPRVQWYTLLIHLHPSTFLVKPDLISSNDAVIYACYNITHTKREIPLIISGHPPHPSSLHTQLSTNNFTIPPRAIITGGGYSDELF